MNFNFLVNPFSELLFSRMWAFYLVPLPLIIYAFSLFFHSFITTSKNRLNQNITRMNDNKKSLFIPKISQLGILSQFKLKYENKKTNFINWLIAALIWFLMIVALANPMKISKPVDVSRKARDLMIAIDLSYSMSSNDFKLGNQVVDRLSATKWVVESFIKQRKGDRIGLILFADRAFSQSPLTFDLKTIETFVKEAEVGLVGKRTAIGDAIALAALKYSGLSSDLTNGSDQELIKKLNELKKKNKFTKNNNKADKILILLTDGANNTGVFSPIKAANLAKDVGLKIYPISIGPDVIYQRSGFFSRKIPRSEYADEKTLKKVAKITGGKYFFAGNTAELKQVYQLINNLEPVKQNNQVFRYQSSFFYFPLGISLFMLLLLIYRRNISLV